ncbi:hypothetical protein APHAL10511_004572 [Amanita phalloides]|nr:hypothetical protein APHAL10511_004572 [Amanita phalloides]
MLDLQGYQLYGRQMILNGFGLPGQLKLQQSAVAVVGAGGLGCPALQYLAAAGIGRIAIIDHDIVELSNLQRQILHSERTIGWNKAKSAAQALSMQYPRLQIDAHEFAVNANNALELLRPYDIVLDCTDNAPTRYLLSDASVLLDKPLVSGAAQKFDGQLCVYNLGPTGPCYRCLFPKPPASALTASCEESGILGVVTGIIGNLQALETIKILTGLHDMKPSLVLFSALNLPFFRTVKLRSRKSNCVACREPKISKLFKDTDYIQSCGGDKPDWELLGLQPGNSRNRLSAKERALIYDKSSAYGISQGFAHILLSSKPKKLIDVRPEVEFGICQIPGFTNIPLDVLVANPQGFLPGDPGTEIYIVCKLGNDSQIAAEAMRSIRKQAVIQDIIGGLKAWARDVDNNFPIY